MIQFAIEPQRDESTLRVFSSLKLGKFTTPNGREPLKKLLPFKYKH